MEQQRRRQSETTAEEQGHSAPSSSCQLHTAQFLREHGVQRLTEDYAISVKAHSEYPNLLQFKYSQIRSPFHSPIVQECRGLILDKADDWRVVAFPYRKFFNYGEQDAATVDWSTAKVYEKLDGSLMILYYYRGKWHVATSSRPDACGSVASQPPLTYAQLFWEIWKRSGYSLPKATHLCYIFELMSERNRIVAHPGPDRVVLHGVRDMRTCLEQDPEAEARRNGWVWAKSYPITSLQDAIAAAAKLNPGLEEGFVVCDALFQRVKVKSPQYVAMAALSVRDRKNMNQRRMLQVVQANEGSEFLSYFPKWRSLYDKVRQAYDALCSYVEEEELPKAPMPSDPNFQEWLQQASEAPFAACLRSLRTGESSSAKEYFAKRPAAEVEALLLLPGITSHKAISSS